MALVRKIWSCMFVTIKTLSQSRGEGFVQCGHFANKGEFFRCGRLHFLVQKTLDFWKLIVSLHGQGGSSVCGHFSEKGEGDKFFWDFVRTPFMDGLTVMVVLALSNLLPREGWWRHGGTPRVNNLKKL